jgi:hypothetical protein
MSWRSDSNGNPHICDHGRLRYVTADTARRRPISGTGNVDKKPEVETGSGNNFGTERVSEAIPTATPTFATMADLAMSLPTPSDIGVNPELDMSTKNRK